MSGKNILSVLAVCGFCSLSAENAAASDCGPLFAHYANSGPFSSYADVGVGDGASDLFFHANQRNGSPPYFWPACDPEMTGETFPGQFRVHFDNDVMSLVYLEADRPPFKLLEIEAENLEFGRGESITAKTALGGSQYTLYLGKRNLTLVRANDSKRTGVDVVLAK